jgi:RNA polymerase sigma-B factor
MGDREREHALFAELNDPSTAPDRVSAVRDELIVMHEPLVRHLCRRYMRPGMDRDDVLQAATLGLIAAVDGFDPGHGAAFSSYAAPHILGEVRRYLRDETSPIRAPRSVHSARARVLDASEALHSSLHRYPTVAELAEFTGLTQERVLEALEHDRPESLDDALPAREPRVDDSTDSVDYWQTVGRALTTLSDRERQILTLRYFEEWSQSAVAQELGISQMHVSRLQRSALAKMRESLGDAYIAA